MDNYPITAQDILDLLPIVADRGWYFTATNRIRDRNGRCPLCALAHEISLGEVDFTTLAVTSMQQLLRIAYLRQPHHDSMVPVYDAADFENHELRPALIEALGGIA